MKNKHILNIVKDNGSYTRKLSYDRLAFKYQRFKTFYSKFFSDDSEMIETILKKCKSVIIKDIGHEKVIFNEIVIRKSARGEPGFNEPNVYIIEICYLHD